MKPAVLVKNIARETASLLLALALVMAFSGHARSGETTLDADSKVVQLNMKYQIRITGRTDRVRLVTLVPKTVEPKQKVLDIRYSLPPARLFESDGNLYAEFILYKVERDIDINIDAVLALRRYDLSSAAAVTARENVSPAFLKSEMYLEKDNPALAAIAGTINGKDEMETVRNIYDYVTSTVVYKGYVREDVGALKVLRDRKYGDCSDYSDAVVALARAKNIPARTVDGFLTEYSDDNPRHTWVEIYTERYGWVPFDPLLGSLRQASYDRLGPKYIYLSGLRNDRTLSYFHFFSCDYAGNPISVTDTYSIKPVKDVMALTQS